MIYRVVSISNNANSVKVIQSILRIDRKRSQIIIMGKHRVSLGFTQLGNFQHPPVSSDIAVPVHYRSELNDAQVES